MSQDAAQPTPPHPDYYEATDIGGTWELRCRVCRVGYRLPIPPAGTDVAVGTLLALLNHAHSHKETK